MAKLVGIALVLAICTVVAVAVAWVYTAILFEPLPIGGWLVMAALAWLALVAWAAITFLASTATGSTTAAAGLGFVALIGLSILAVVPAVDHVLPTGLTLPSILIAERRDRGRERRRARDRCPRDARPGRCVRGRRRGLVRATRALRR